jgi:hypothetical protein
MQFEYKGEIKTFPAQLSEITLGQRVSFYATHGPMLEQLAKDVEEAKDDFEKEMAITILNSELAVCEFAHYTGIDLEEVKNHIEFDSLMTIYAVDMMLLREQEAAIELQPSYDWNGEKWVIDTPQLTPTSKMSFNEFLHGKEVVRQLAKLGKGKWEALPYLCAIYLRKEGETFTEELVTVDGERLKLMLQLSLDIALAVGFFLSSTLSTYMSTLASSGQEVERESTQPATSITGDGSLSLHT